MTNASGHILRWMRTSEKGGSQEKIERRETWYLLVAFLAGDRNGRGRPAAHSQATTAPGARDSNWHEEAAAAQSGRRSFGNAITVITRFAGVAGNTEHGALEQRHS